jgi:hypothetical protein
LTWCWTYHIAFWQLLESFTHHYSSYKWSWYYFFSPYKYVMVVGLVYLNELFYTFQRIGSGGMLPLISWSYLEAMKTMLECFLNETGKHRCVASHNCKLFTIRTVIHHLCIMRLFESLVAPFYRTFCFLFWHEQILF